MFLTDADLIINQYIGFGTGNTQEIQLFRYFPQLTVFPQITSKLEENESVVFTNMYNTQTRKFQTILCIDAYNVRVLKNTFSAKKFNLIPV